MIDYLHFHAFYLLLFTFLTILVIVIGIVIRDKISDKKDTVIFAKSSDNAKEVTISVTDKMADMHDDVVKAQFTENHEHELHRLQRGLEEISAQLSILTARVLKLEQEKRYNNNNKE